MLCLLKMFHFPPLCFCRVLAMQDYLVPKVTLVLLDTKGFLGLQAPQVLVFQAPRGQLGLKEIRDILALPEFLGDQALQVRGCVQFRFFPPGVPTRCYWLKMHVFSVSPGEVEECCHEYETGSPGPKGQPGSTGKSHGCYCAHFRHHSVAFNHLVIDPSHCYL